MIKPTLLILAAGLGSRYGGLKQLDGVGPNDEPILEYSVYDALRAGFGKVVFVIRPDFAADFKEKIMSKFADRGSIEAITQDLDRLPEGFSLPSGRQKPWGTGHALLAAEMVIDEPFVAINADDLYGSSAYRLLAQYLTQISNLQATDYAMVGYVLRKTLSPFGGVARGRCQVKGGYLESIIELTKIEKDGQEARYTDAAEQIHPLSGDEIVSMNFWGFTPAIFPDLQALFRQFLQTAGQTEKAEFYVSNAIGELIQANQARVKVFTSPDSWLGITYRADKPYVVEKVQQLINQGVYPENLWA